MNKPPLTDPKTDLKIRCFLCGALVVEICKFEDEDVNNCFTLQKRMKADHKRAKRNGEYFSFNSKDFKL